MVSHVVQKARYRWPNSGRIGRHAGGRDHASVRKMSKSANSVLVIDDESQIRRLVSTGLELHGFAVKEAESGAIGLSAAVHLRPDVIILDLGLPDMSGIEVLKSIRAWSNVPVIVVSINSDMEQKVMLLKLGADDYIVKPFGIAELAARCEAALRPYHKSADKSPIVQTGARVVNLVSRSVSLGEKQILLTRREYRLLHVLAAHLGLVVTHGQLFEEIWGKKSSESMQYLRSLVRLLRQKIEPDPAQPKFLITESGVRYRLERHKEEMPNSVKSARD
jgi:two-component system KDP operon response regulator KdpE